MPIFMKVDEKKTRPISQSLRITAFCFSNYAWLSCSETKGQSVQGQSMFLTLKTVKISWFHKACEFYAHGL